MNQTGIRGSYHRDHVGRLLRALGWSCQVPQRRARERDETGFPLIPTVCRTWAPRAQTPVLRHSFRHDRLSVISGLTVSPRRQRLGLVYRIHRQNINGERACVFLRELRRHLFGPLIVIWDNVRQFRARSENLDVARVAEQAIALEPAGARDALSTIR